jgi:hypothetical protein
MYGRWGYILWDRLGPSMHGGYPIKVENEILRPGPPPLQHHSLLPQPKDYITKKQCCGTGTGNVTCQESGQESEPELL